MPISTRAVEGLVDAIWFNGGQVCCAGLAAAGAGRHRRDFNARLIARMGKIRVGDPLDKAIDMGAMVHAEQQARVEAMLARTSGTVHRGHGARGLLPAPGSGLGPALRRSR